MIISRGRSYVFVHIPKTGGTSLAAALEARAMADDILIGDTPKARRRRGRLEGLSTRGRLWKHSSLSDIDGLLSTEELARMFVFTLVRNPWDRLVSYYAWARAQRFDHPAVRAARALDFEGFLDDPSIAESLTRRPARTYVTDITGTERCDAFLRLEHLDTDLAPVEAHLGFRLDIPHLNRSARPPAYRDAHTEHTRQRTAEICAEDIARFGYAW